MKCMNCGERPAAKDFAVCTTCRDAFAADGETPTLSDCTRSHPWPGCTCAACLEALDKRFADAAEVHSKLAAEGGSLLDGKPGRRPSSGEEGEVVLLRFSPSELLELRRAAAICGMRRNAWIKRAAIRQSWSELQGDADVAKRIGELTRLVEDLSKQVTELRRYVQRPSGRPRRL